jgi:ribokinase
MVAPEPPDVVVFGSANVDLSLAVTRLPASGETVVAAAAERTAGGKGANQAVAAARYGSATTLICALGPDADAEALQASLTAAGVTMRARVAADPTGQAVVLVDDAGANAIVVLPGANATLAALEDGDRRVIAQARVLLTQLEVPVSGAAAAIAAARVAGTQVILNAAPALRMPIAVAADVDLLVVNEGEAAALGGRRPEDLLDDYRAVVVTLGARGSRYFDRSGRRIDTPAPGVTVVDTTAAGDTFCGVLAAALSRDVELPAALAQATAAAALTVTRPGAQAAIPERSEYA